MILVFPVIRFQKSVTTMKPRAPKMESVESITFIDVLFMNPSKLLLYNPKPAVQNAETLWYTLLHSAKLCSTPACRKAINRQTAPRLSVTMVNTTTDRTKSFI